MAFGHPEFITPLLTMTNKRKLSILRWQGSLRRSEKLSARLKPTSDALSSLSIYFVCKTSVCVFLFVCRQKLNFKPTQSARNFTPQSVGQKLLRRSVNSVRDVGVRPSQTNPTRHTYVSFMCVCVWVVCGNMRTL